MEPFDAWLVSSSRAFGVGYHIQNRKTSVHCHNGLGPPSRARERGGAGSFGMAEDLHLTTKEWLMQKCLRPQSSLLTIPPKRTGIRGRELTDWLMRLLWRLKPFHPPSIT